MDQTGIFCCSNCLTFRKTKTWYQPSPKKMEFQQTMGLNLHFYAFSKEVIQSKHVNPHLEILVNEKKPNVSSSNASTVSGLNVSLSCFSFDDFPACFFSSSLSLFSLVFLFLLYCTRGETRSSPSLPLTYPANTHTYPCRDGAPLETPCGFPLVH